jgi:hypothetical protein
LNAENTELQHLAKKSCTSYLKCVHLMKDKTVFNVRQIDLQALASSYGLVNAPEIDFVQEEVVLTKDDRIKKLRQAAFERR